LLSVVMPSVIMVSALAPIYYVCVPNTE